ncbi:MAG: 4-vinyl reductase [Anaerolineae bacterium]|nr:4-vinyl reductase [Anaerolineae bacterium]
MLELSGFYYPNRFARSFLLATEAVLTAGGLAAVLSIAELDAYTEQLPSDDLKRQFDFAYLSAINLSLEEMYGTRGGHGMALRIGRTWFTDGLREFGLLAGLADANFQALPLEARAEFGLQALARVFNTYSDQHCAVNSDTDHFYFTVAQSPMTWGRQSERSVCHALVGALQGCLHYASDSHEYHVYEQTCRAVGGSQCVFAINRNPIGQVGRYTGG